MAVFRAPMSAADAAARAKAIAKDVTAPVVDFQSGGIDAGISMTVSGLGLLEQRLRLVPKVYRDAAGRAMEEMAAQVIRDAIEGDYVPVDTGDLISSGRSDQYVPGSNATIVEIAMWFGGTRDSGIGSGEQTFSAITMPEGMDRAIASIMHRRGASYMAATQAIHGEEMTGKKAHHDPSEYAAEQHENMEYKHPRGGGPKYLERPLLKRVPEMITRIAAAAEIDMLSFVYGSGVATGTLQEELAGFNALSIGPIKTSIG